MNKKIKKLSLLLAAFFAFWGMLYFASNAFAAANTGTYTSEAINIGQSSSFGTITWSDTTPASTSVSMEIRSGDAATPDSSWTAWKTISKGASFAGQYIQYRATLNSDNIDNVPTIDSVTISYQYAPYDYTLISSPFNSTSSDNAMSRINWTENLPTGTDVKFQIATSQDNVTWTDFVGPDGTTNTYYTDPTATDMYASFQSGNNDQYFKYKVYLSTTDLSQTPTVSDITTYYVVNSPPDFDSTFGTNGTQVAQISDSNDSNWGKVKIQYKIRDVDATGGNITANYVTPTFQYYDGSIWQDIDSDNVTMELNSGQDCIAEEGKTCVYDQNADGKYDNKVLEGDYLTYSAYWDAKTQLGQTYIDSTDFKVKVALNDNEGANNTANAESNLTLLDTKNPVAGSHPVLIDATESPAQVTLDCTDNSSLKMNVNLNNIFLSALTENFSASKTITLESDPDTVYAEFQDIYGNTTQTYSVTTPETPIKMMVQDTSNMKDLDNPEFRLFIAWKKIAIPPAGTFGSYEVYRSTGSGLGTKIKTIEDININYYGDSDVEENQSYTYKVFSKDGNGNTSYVSEGVSAKANGVQDSGEGGGGTSNVPPVITSVATSDINTTQATITWNTDLLSNSSVGYYKGDSGSYTDNTQAIDEMKNDEAHQGQHRVVLTGLDSNSTYHYQVSSTDASGNIATSGEGTFTTDEGPEISGVNVDDVSNNQVTIIWKTDTNSNSIVHYSTSIAQDGSLSNPITLGADSANVGGSAPYDHNVTIENLTQNTVYYFYVESIDSGSNSGTDNNGTNFYSFTTTLDQNPPEISDISEPMVNSSQAAIHWLTDEPATSKVQYSTNNGGPYSSEVEVTTFDKGHYIILSNLTPNQDYYYKIVSEDISSNSETSGEQSFTTLVDTEFDHDPLSAVTDTNVPEKHISDDSAVVTFNTDQEALCSIELASISAEGSSTLTHVFETGYEDALVYNKSHAIRLTDLANKTEYTYKISCHDNILNDENAEEDTDKFKNWAFSGEETFTTLEKQISESQVSAGDATAPEISGVSVGSVTGESATITWDTDEDANSLVKYGITSEVYDNMAGDPEINSDNVNFSKAHTVTINGLIPATRYYYVAFSYDSSGNIGESSQGTFTTKSPSSLSSIKVESKNLGEATITWKTDTDTTSIIEYGLETSYGEKKESSSYAKEHSISLSNLEQGQIYHYRVKGKDKSGNLYASADNTFEPKSPPKITAVNINDVSEHGATVTFQTNVPADSNVIYTDLDTKETGSQGSRDLTQDHKVTLQNLNQGTTYTIQIGARDDQGVEGTVEGPNLTTGKDENPPKIDQVRTDSALTQNDKVQTIVSWKTDEQATTAVLYREGRTGEEKELKVSENLATGHIAVITSFKLGTVYNLRVKSIDASGNTATSGQYTLLTPRRKENIIQIITNNFQDIFGWMGAGR